MRILYKQKSEKSNFSLEIKGCTLKEIEIKNDYKKTTLKNHSHNEFEVHIIVSGMQCYETAEAKYDVKEGEFIIIPPGVKHRVADATDNMQKFSVIFSYDEKICDGVYYGILPGLVAEGLDFIRNESYQKRPFGQMLVENRVFEILVLLMREAGYKNEETEAREEDDGGIELARRFIADNIEHNLSVGDVAAYCHISTRQLARNFLQAEGVSPAKYINRVKMEEIIKYLKQTDLSLKQISERFSYSSEFYFNAAFKKYSGMPPLAYRNMFR